MIDVPTPVAIGAILNDVQPHRVAARPGHYVHKLLDDRLDLWAVVPGVLHERDYAIPGHGRRRLRGTHPGGPIGVL